MLPIPTDPNFKMPEVTEEQFNNAHDGDDWVEDEDLLKTGAWDDYEEEEEDEEQ
jgi:hypothetical protein